MLDKDIVSFENLLKTIYDNKAKIEDEKIQTSLALKEAEELRKNLKSQNFDILHKEKDLISNAKLEAKQILLEAKETANDIIKDISFSTSSSEANKLRNLLNDKINSIKTDTDELEITNSIPRENIKPNLNVFVSNLNADGVVLSNISKDDTVQVQVGSMKIKVDIKFLQSPKGLSTNKKTLPYNKLSSKSQIVSPEINILGLTVDEAIPIVDKYLDDCFIANLSPVRIVHGKGTGALRNSVHSFLKKNKLVDSFRLGTFGEGEMGITVVSLKLRS